MSRNLCEIHGLRLDLIDSASFLHRVRTVNSNIMNVITSVNMWLIFSLGVCDFRVEELSASNEQSILFQD